MAFATFSALGLFWLFILPANPEVLGEGTLAGIVRSWATRILVLATVPTLLGAGLATRLSGGDERRSGALLVLANVIGLGAGALIYLAARSAVMAGGAS